MPLDNDVPLETSSDIRLDGDRQLHASFGMFGITRTENLVWLSIPDRFGNPALYNFSHPDWARVVELISSTQATAESNENPKESDR